MHFAKLSTNAVKLAEKSICQKGCRSFFFCSHNNPSFHNFFSSKKRAALGRIGMYIVGLGTYFRFRKSNQQIAAVQQILLLTQLSKQKQVAFAFMVLFSNVEKKLSPFFLVRFKENVLFISYVCNVKEHSHMMSDFQVSVVICECSLTKKLT